MTLSYDDIFSNFLGCITDYQIASMELDDINEMMVELMQKAVAKPYVRRLFTFISFDNELQNLEYEMSFVIDEDSDNLFIIEVIAKGMVIEWLQPQVKNKLLTSQFFGGKEQKWFAQANQLSEVRGLLEDAQLEQRKLIRDRGYINNPYLEG